MAWNLSTLLRSSWLRSFKGRRRPVTVWRSRLDVEVLEERTPASSLLGVGVPLAPAGGAKHAAATPADSRSATVTTPPRTPATAAPRGTATTADTSHGHGRVGANVAFAAAFSHHGGDDPFADDPFADPLGGNKSGHKGGSVSGGPSGAAAGGAGGFGGTLNDAPGTPTQTTGTAGGTGGTADPGDTLWKAANTQPTTTARSPSGSAASPLTSGPTSAGTSTTPTKPVLLGHWKPKPKPGGAGLASPSNPYVPFVLDANTAEPVFQGPAYRSFSTWGMDLRAQVSGATIVSYSWNLANAPDATNVTGANTYDVRFTWGTFSGGPHPEVIALTTVDSNLNTQTQNFLYFVDGIGSPAWASTPPTTAATWQPLVAPDQLKGNADAVSGAGFSVNLTAGDLLVGHDLPSYNPALTPLGLTYSSNRADPAPVFLENYTLDPARPDTPTQVVATLSFNGSPVGTTYYSTAGFNPGDIVQLALPYDAAAAGVPTGRYGYSIALTAVYSAGGNETPPPLAGSVSIVQPAASDFAPGWSLGGLTRLYPVAGGAILDNGDGTSLWYASDGSGGYLTPPGDYSTLAAVGGGYRLTLKDGTQLGYDGAGEQTSVTDRNGLSTTFAYSAGQLVSITDPETQVVNIGYAGGRATSITDPAGRATQLAYDGAGRLTQVTDPDTNAYRYAYDGASPRVNAITDPNSNTTSFGFTNSKVSSITRPGTTAEQLTPGQQQAVPAPGSGTSTNPAPAVLAVNAPAVYVDPNANTWVTFADWVGFGTGAAFADGTGYLSLTYRDAAALPWLDTDNLADRTRTFFDAKANPLKTVLPDDNYVQAQFDPTFSEVTQYTDENGGTTNYGLDAHGNVTTVTDALTKTWHNSYDGRGRLTLATDPYASDSTTYAYDNRDRLTQTTDAYGKSQTLAYDNAGNVTAATDRRNKTTSYTYDNAGRVKTMTTPDGGAQHPVWQYSYDGDGNRTTVTDPLQHVTTSKYDGRNRLTQVTDFLNHTTSYAFDGNGNQTSVTDGNTHTTSYRYDGDNRRTSMTDADTHTTSYGYDAAGRETSITDANNHTTNFAYDARGLRTSTTDALNHTTQFAYDKAGNQTSVTDALNHTTQYFYDPDNRLTKTTDALTRSTLYGYDDAGRQTTVTDPDNNVTTTYYDNDSRVTKVTDQLNHSTTYGYDDAGNLTTTTDRDGRTRTFGYDNVNRRTSENWLDSNGNATYTISYQYDDAGRLTLATDPDSSYAYSYDNADRLTSVDNQGTPSAPHVVINYGYDNANNKTSVSDNFSGTASYTFDNGNRLTQATELIGGTLRAKSVLGYDNGNRLTAVTDSTGGTPTINRAFSYDNADRLTQVRDSSSSAGALASYTYGYDNANRVTSYTGPDGSLSYGYDLTNQLTGVTGAHSESYGYDNNGNRNTNGNVPGTDNRQQSDGTYNYAYDNEGNVTTQTLISTGQYTVFSYDDRNRLIEAVLKNASGQTLHDDKFVYDVNDRRIGKSVDGVWTWTAYDGSNAFADFTGAGALTEHYLYGLAADSLLARVDSGNNAAFYLTDRNGSVRQLVTVGGVVLDQLTYDSFGYIRLESAVANGDRFKYTSREYDSELGLYYYRAREYAPTAGKFLSEDPSGLGPDVNKYRYVRNNPTIATDPSGLQDTRYTRTLDKAFETPEGAEAQLKAGAAIVGLISALFASKAPPVGPQIGPKPGPGPKQVPDGPKVDKKVDEQAGPKKDCQAQWEADQARIARIARKMKDAGYSNAEIARWIAAASARAAGRKQRCEDGLPDTLKPYPAPPGVED
jgi:RHS repeat-associated protein